MVKWLNRPKITPLQFLIAFIAFFYFIYMNTELFENLPELFKALIYAGGLIMSALAGYSAIDSRRLGHLIKKTMRQKDKTLEVRWGECIDIIDNTLYDLDNFINKKKVKKKNG